jgi:hypothetical protein
VLLSVWFWIVMILWLVLGFWAEYVPGQPYPWPRGGRHLLMFLAVLILGLQVFGGPVK